MWYLECIVIILLLIEYRKQIIATHEEESERLAGKFVLLSGEVLPPFPESKKKRKRLFKHDDISQYKD